MDRYDRAMLKLDALAQGRYESPTTYGKRVWRLFLQVDEDEESWVVRKFINGIRDEEFWRILRVERNRNKTMGLGIAMKRLKALYKLAEETDYDPDSESEDESEPCAEESDNNTEFEEDDVPISYFIVRTIPYHILSDPVAFNQFLKSSNSIPSFDRMGPFSRKAIEALQAAHGRQSSAASQEKLNQVAEESAKVIARGICMITADSTSRQSERITEMDMCSQSKKTAIPRNELPPPDLWVELPFHRDLTADASSVAAIEPIAINAQSGLSSETLEAADCELDMLRFADEGMNWYQNTTGEKKVEKWREKGYGENELEKDEDGSMMVPGMEEDFTWDLVGIAVTEGAEQEVDRVNRERTADERESSGGPHCSEDLTIDAIRNPSIQPIRTASEWDPGPGAPVEAIPVIDKYKDGHLLTSSDIHGIAGNTVPHEPVNPAAEYLWPPDFRGPDPTSAAYSNYLDSDPDTQTATNSEHNGSKRSLGNLLYVSSGLRRAAEPHQLRGQRIQESGDLKGNCCVELWILGDGLGVFLYNGQWFRYEKYFGHCKRALKEIGGGLIGGFGGNRIWDPGGGRAESLFMAGRCGKRRESRAGWDAMEKGELGKLARRQAFGF